MKCKMCQQVANFRARNEGEPFEWWCKWCYDVHEHQQIPDDIEHQDFPSKVSDKVCQELLTLEWELIEDGMVFWFFGGHGFLLIHSEFGSLVSGFVNCFWEVVVSQVHSSCHRTLEVVLYGLSVFTRGGAVGIYSLQPTLLFREHGRQQCLEVVSRLLISVRQEL